MGRCTIVGLTSSWLLPALIATAISHLILVLVYLYLYFQERQRFIGLWVCGWACHLLRYLAEISLFCWPDRPLMVISTQIFNFIGGILLLVGVYVFLEKSISRWWLYGTVISGMFIAAGWLKILPAFVENLVIFTLLGAIYVWTGASILRNREIRSAGQKLTGWALVLWGLHKGNYPFLRPAAWIAPWGYLAAAFLALVAALGFVMVYYERARNRLSENQEWLRITLNSIGDAVIATDTSGRIKFLNPVAEILTGYTEKEALNRPVGEIFKIINEDSRQPAEIPVERVLEEGRIIGLANHTVLLSRTGEELSIADSASPIKNETGAPPCRHPVRSRPGRKIFKGNYNLQVVPASAGARR